MISLVLIAEDSLSEVVAKKIIDAANKNYEVVNVIFWNKKLLCGNNRSKQDKALKRCRI